MENEFWMQISPGWVPPLLNRTYRHEKRPKITGSYEGGEDVQCGASLPCDSYKV